MPILLFNNLTEKDKTDAVKKLITNSTPRQGFFLMIILSVLMATFGLMINNIAVVIGSMLIAPMLYPIMSLALGVVMSDPQTMRRSAITIIKSILLGLTASALVTLFADPLTKNYPQDMITGAEPSLAYVAIAIVAGLAASFALIRPKMSESLPGVAISVALIPPLAATGIGIARFDRHIVSNAFILLIINIIGIVFASIIIFSLMNLYVKRNIARKTIKDEAKQIAKEEKKAAKQIAAEEKN